MSDLSRSLVDAAATGMHDTRCVCMSAVTHVEAYREAASVAVAAVLETLADGIETANWPMSISRLRGLAAEVKTGEDR